MQSSTSLGLGSRESLDNDDDDHRSQYFDAYQGEEPVNNGNGEINQETLFKPPTSTPSTTRDGAGIRPSSARTASVPIIQYGGTRNHRRSSNSTSQTQSRPATSGQTSSRGASTAPTSTQSSRPNSRRYSPVMPQAGPSGFLPRDTRSLLRRSVTTTPRPSTSTYTSILPSDYVDHDDEDAPPIIRGVSYPGRSIENLGSHSSSNLPLTPLSPNHDRRHSITSILGRDPSTSQQRIYTNYTPPANIDWISPETRRKHYSKIDKATTGLRGVWTRFAPKKFGGGSKYGKFYRGADSDAGSVRRFRQELRDEEGAGEGEGQQKKRRFFGFGGRKGMKSP